jgi:hypothetical protein
MRAIPALLLLALSAPSVAQDTVLKFTVHKATERKPLVQTGGQVALTLDGSVYTLTPTADVTTWDVSLPEGANPDGFVYASEVFVLPGAGHSVTLPASWISFNCEKSMTLSASPLWIVVQTFPGDQIACTTSAEQ